MTAATLMDVVLVAGLTLIAYRALHASNVITAIAFYIAFGLLMSLIWVRLSAPDLALAEAAIGAGVVGALMLDSARWLEREADATRPITGVGAAVGALAASGFTVVLAFAFWRVAAPGPPGLPEAVDAGLAVSGARNPVTAVLLNFRGYDTMLEVGVLFVAAVGVLVVRWASGAPKVDAERWSTSPVANGAARVIAPIGIVIAGYLLWRGTTYPGGAFQAGAVLGALGVLVCLLGYVPPMGPASIWPRFVIVAGFGVFILIGFAGLALEDHFAAYPPGREGLVMVLVESAVAISVAGTLILLFAGARRARGGSGAPGG